MPVHCASPLTVRMVRVLSLPLRSRIQHCKAQNAAILHHHQAGLRAQREVLIHSESPWFLARQQNMFALVHGVQLRSYQRCV